MAKDKDGKKDDDDSVSKKEFDELKRSLAGLANLPKTMEQLGAGMTALSNQVKGMETARLDDVHKKKVEKVDLTADQLEDMSNGQLVSHIVKTLSDKLLPAINEKFDILDQRATKSDLRTQVTKAEGDHRDFWEWQEEMTSLAKLHPDLTINRLYTLAKSENPDKASELEKKADSEKKADVKKEEDAAPFGGLLPTSGITVPEGESSKDIKEASNSAWDKVMADVPMAMLQGDN